MKFRMEVMFDSGVKVRSFLNLFSTISEVRIFNEILVLCDKDDLVYHSTRLNRDRICERTSLSDVTVKNSMVVFVKKELLIKQAKGIYRINPRFIKMHNRDYINK